MNFIIYTTHLFFVHNFLGLSFLHYIFKKFRRNIEIKQMLLTAFVISAITGIIFKYSIQHSEYCDFLANFSYLKKTTYQFILAEILLIALIYKGYDVNLLLFLSAFFSTLPINFINSLEYFRPQDYWPYLVVVLSVFYKMIHLLLASIITACASLLSYMKSCKEHSNTPLIAKIGFLACVCMLFTSHFHIQHIAKTDYKKFAAMEAIWPGSDKNKFIVFAKINEFEQKNEYEVAFPLMNIMMHYNPVNILEINKPLKVREKFYSLRGMLLANFLLMAAFYKLAFRRNKFYGYYKFIFLLPAAASYLGLKLSVKDRYEFVSKRN